MIQKEFGFWAPDWGDWSNGEHWVSHTRDVYQRDFIRPKEVELSMAIVGERDGGWLIKFAIDQVINRRTPDFESELLYNLNLLQENVSAVDVFESDADMEQYAARIRVDWQILPPGTVDEVMAQMLRGKGAITDAERNVMRERVAVINDLKPEAFVTGSDAFLRYFGAKFGDDFVVFENLRYGNALYVMHEGWEVLSQKSRLELLAGPRDAFDRIPHAGDWAGQLRGRVQKYRSRK
jgi:hypothetical protein